MLRCAAALAALAGASACSFAQCPKGCVAQVKNEYAFSETDVNCDAQGSVLENTRPILTSCQSAVPGEQPVSLTPAVCQAAGTDDGVARVTCGAEGRCRVRFAVYNQGSECACPEETKCKDKRVADGTVEWFDIHGRTCNFYRHGGKVPGTQELRRCKWRGSQERYANFGMTASEACCMCGGGQSVDPAAKPAQTFGCANDEWVDSRDRGCAYYAKQVRRCNKRDQFASADGRTAKDACCVCGGGTRSPKCPPRVRRAYSELTCAERNHFAQAVAKFKGEQPAEWNSFVDVHQEQFGFAHGTSNFLHWHRWYLINFENALRSQEGFECVTLPYWDWDKEAGRERNALPLRPDTFGSAQGVSPNEFFPFGPGFSLGSCVTDGIVAEFETSATPFGMGTERPMCLLRQNQVGAPQNGELSQVGEWFASETVLAGLFVTYPTFEDLRPRLEGLPHANPHNFIGGHMLTPWSPNDPLFWMHHANVDRVFSVWQDYFGHDEVPKPDLQEPEHYHAEIDDACEPAGCAPITPCPPGCSGLPGEPPEQGCPPPQFCQALCPEGCTGAPTETCPPCVALPPTVPICTNPQCNQNPLESMGLDAPMRFWGPTPPGPPPEPGVPPPAPVTPSWLEGVVTIRDMHSILDMPRPADSYSYGNDALAHRLGKPLKGDWDLVVPAAAEGEPADHCDAPQPCILQCGTKVPHGWRGAGEGPDNSHSCNQVRCVDGEVVVMTRRLCMNADPCPARQPVHAGSSSRGAAAQSRASCVSLCQAAKSSPGCTSKITSTREAIERMKMNYEKQKELFSCQGLLAKDCAAACSKLPAGDEDTCQAGEPGCN